MFDQNHTGVHERNTSSTGFVKAKGGSEPIVTDTAARTNVRSGENVKIDLEMSALTCLSPQRLNAAVAARIADIRCIGKVTNWLNSQFAGQNVNSLRLRQCLL